MFRRYHFISYNFLDEVRICHFRRLIKRWIMTSLDCEPHVIQLYVCYVLIPLPLPKTVNPQRLFVKILIKTDNLKFVSMWSKINVLCSIMYITEQWDTEFFSKKKKFLFLIHPYFAYFFSGRKWKLSKTFSIKVLN